MAMSIKTYKYYIVPILSMLTLSACKDFDDSITNLSEVKTPIELSVGDDSSPITRAVVIDGRGKITAFENDTRLHLLMISHDKTKDKTETSTDKYTETYGEAKGSGKSVSSLNPDESQWAENEKRSVVSFESGKGVYRYWDDAHGRESLLSIYGFANVWAIQPTGSPWYPRLDRTAAPGTETGTETNNFPATWGTPNAAMGTFVGGSVDATYNTTGKWIVGDFTPNNNKKYQEQTKTSILSKDDICYSNNLADYSDNTSLPEAERTDNRPHFEASTTPKHFTGGTMVFHRAMCLFTFKVYMGGGFSESDFKFKDGTNIAMKGFNKKGFLNIKDGEWTASSIEVGTDASYEGVTGYSWSKIDLTNEDKTDKSMDTDTGGKYWQLLAFAIPGTDLTTTPTVADALTMNINGNVYKVSMQQLYDAIAANGANCESGTPNGTVKSDYLTGGTKLKAGINYEFSFTIGKTAINKITAKVVDWETVTADDITPTNARITLDLLDTGDAQSAGVDFYRGLNYNDATDINDNWSSYTWQPIQYEKAEAEYTDGHWTTKWVWESNRHFYNFRAIMPANHAINGNSEAPYNPNFALSAGPSGTYTDVKWGAPFKNTTNKLTYSTSKGFDGKAAETTDNHQIYKAIGPTNSPIKLISFHMMSEVEINLATTADTDPTHIDFGDGTTVTKIKLNGCTQTGTVNLGDGCVTPGTTKEAVFLSETLSNSNKKLTYGVVPQSLEGAELRITTADGNEYLVDLASVVITATAANPTNNNIANPYDVVDGKCTINYWYPGFKYIYNLTLTKKGIADLKATIVNWETVTVNQGGITIQ